MRQRRPSTSSPSQKPSRARGNSKLPSDSANLNWTRPSAQSLVVSYPFFSPAPLKGPGGKIKADATGRDDGESDLERQSDCRKRDNGDCGRECVFSRVQPQARIFSPQQHHINLSLEGAGQ